jgi:hypothetical protein
MSLTNLTESPNAGDGETALAGEWRWHQATVKSIGIDPAYGWQRIVVTLLDVTPWMAGKVEWRKVGRSACRQLKALLDCKMDTLIV